ncbi:Nif3-like dinuclear metal center hexameric protein [Clostridium sp. 'White wine YQ']|uniref:Nif3-like dinuclear metal center hexameric protein n=1 Tax=Clostridium sp. 'White wine YQ' TaxID=3027474 RepID=UPI00236731FB|nr:Nif3-like dinuclear metal center hexameric protein [Clostridium sp. 'White wine YQ']MDD7794511.1 Nif3-like dinuclear metal center hexameric protein [Clostridium sp. 'White wine YQ']
MKVNDIIDVMENIAPPFLKEDYDNVGLMVGSREAEVSKILIALDATLEVIEEAKELGAELIITHHPLLFRKPSSITDDTLLGKKIISLIKNNISLYSSHTNFDSVKGGLNDKIVELLGFESKEIMSPVNINGFNESGLGRVIELNEGISLEDLNKRIKSSLGVKNLRCVIGSRNPIKKIAIINGSGQDFFSLAYSKNVDCIITGDTTYHYASDYREMGVSIMDIGHYGSEWPVFVALSENIKQKLENKVEIIISGKTMDPYDFF